MVRDHIGIKKHSEYSQADGIEVCVLSESIFYFDRGGLCLSVGVVRYA